jgi:hypothetical protein
MTGMYQQLVITDPTGRKLPLMNGQRYVIGSDVNATIRLDDATVLPRHAMIGVTPRGAWIEDLGTTAGTFVNSVRIVGQHPLRPGDGIIVGRRTLAVSATAAPVAPQRVLTTSFKAGYERAYDRAAQESEERWYKRAYMVSFSLRSTRLRFFLPLLLAGFVGMLVAVLPGEVRVSPEAFSVLATTIPTFAIAVFVVLERKVPDRAPEEDESTKYDRWTARGEGVSIGVQIFLGELLAVWGVAASSTNLLLLLLTGSVALTQVVYLTSYTFGFAHEVDFDPGTRR